MALGRQVHNGIWLMLRKNPFDLISITDIHLLEAIPLVRAHLRKGFKVSSIGQLIQINYAILCVGDDVPNDGRTYKTCATRNKYFHW